LVDAAETHRRAIPDSQDVEAHRAVAALIERIIDARNPVLKI
jgi:hypothetical protein